ncbi:CG2 omega domain protein [Vibrio diabolicus]|uniref:CG2 omega domain protein n=1 Tax=Vibrio diabolicus TaxID=50719 RepID=UPI00215C29AD|nr:CG2 omega domain protein [Vibrio diabolicus]MCR9471719.1 CG2 omega domain protein [Vibrio diabolicus]MCS0329890.1 CG2 omega domain protein [Vibrio diabolicus]
MKKALLLAAILLPLASAHAEISVKGDGFELSNDCVRLSGDNVSIKSDDCSSKQWKDKDNSSVHGDDNPGKGHNKDKKDKKK